MKKIEFKELNKEQMIIAFNQLKDDYHNVFEENENLKSVLKEIRELLGHFECGQVCECTQELAIHVLEIIDKALKGGDE